MSLGRQWDSRLKIWDEAFESNLYTPLEGLSVEGFTTMEFLSLDAVRAMDFRPFTPGMRWGRKWEYGWFRCRIHIPDEAKGRRVMVHLGIAPEMLLFVDGHAAGSIDARHPFVEVTDRAIPGHTYEIYAEGYAGHGPRLENGGIYPRDCTPVPEPPENQITVEESHFGLWNETMFSAYADYHTLYELMLQLPPSSLRAMEIARALKEFTYTADFEADEPTRTQSVARAAGLLQPLLQKHNGDTMPAYTVFGQSHLDLAWLWTGAETTRKSARTYANQLKLMERYPEYRFFLCCPTILENLKQYYPDLYAQIQDKYREGNFIPEGAAWIECDTNLPNGESLIRQLVKGKRWFAEEFGTDSKLLWLPDCFGFSGALPQILAGCRIPYFATQKLLRCDPECEPFPYNQFWWEGIDGSRILSHIYYENNANFTPSKLCARWEQNRNQKEEVTGMLFPFGYGDGGGGPTEIMLETYRRCRDLEGLPRCNLESPVRFFESLEQTSIANVYYGELYLAWHRGTYTVQGKLKKKLRQAEFSLREAEYLAGLLRLELKRLDESVTEKLDRLWNILLSQQFHDVLAGTSIERVNDEAKRALGECLAESRRLAKSLLVELAGESAVFNSLSWERDYQGITLPPCGYVTLTPQKTVPPAKAPAPWQVTRGNGEVTISNFRYTAVLDDMGRILSLRDAETGTEYAEAPLNELRLYQDVNIYYDAWEIGSMYEQIPVPLTSQTAFSLEEGKDRATVSIERREPYFTWKQKIVFSANCPEIVFETEVDWRERHRMLKVDFPTTVFTREILEEIQFGYLKRPTHRSRQYEKDLYETCHHKYAALTDGANGIALINDCKYGLSAQDSRISLTLLRAPAVPDQTADQGTHRFRYALLTFRGPFQYSDVPRRSYEFNAPPTVSAAETMDAASVAEAHSFFQIEGAEIFIETCKPAMDADDSIILRLYEPMGMAGCCTLLLPPQTKTVWLCNMLEEPLEQLPLESGKIRLRFRTFEIKTLLLHIIK